MGDPRGFLEIDRKEPGYRPVEERLKDFNEVEERMSDEELQQQAARCMDCGIPFCHGCGCPLGNLIPEWNDLVYNGFWKEALDLLCFTNNFPEFTGRICPALCETSCTVGLNGEPVAIRQIEINLIEKGYAEGYIKPNPPEVRSEKKVAVIGSGPAGLAVADQLNKMGHNVTVFEKDKSVGGYLRYGIPDFKLDKKIVQRRVDLMQQEGVLFETGVNIGIDMSADYLNKKFDAICVTMGARAPRDLPIEGRDLKGVHFAMEFLGQQNKRVANESFSETDLYAENKNIVVIGGGDTGSDCVGTSNRHGAKSVTQIEIMPKPPEGRDESTPWPEWPYQLRTSSSHKEGCERMWNVMSKSFEGVNGTINKINAIKVEWDIVDGRPTNLKEVAGSGFVIEADLVLLSMGFTGAEKSDIFSQFDLTLDKRGNVQVDDFGYAAGKVFAAGDVVTGASLVVNAITLGRKLADSVDKFMTK